MLILTEENIIVINKGQVTIGYLESRNHCITFNGDISNNPLVFKTINVDSYVSFFHVKMRWSPNAPHLKVKIA